MTAKAMGLESQERCDTLLLNLRPTINRNAIHGSLVDRRPGQSFLSNPTDQPPDQYLQLANQPADGCTLG